jgi:LacI family transcriptional regulator
MLPRRSVALLIETSNAYARGVLEGIIDYVRHHERWSIYLPEQGRGGKPPGWLAKWRGDGIIARIETDDIARAARRIGCPIVDVSAARHLANIPWVETDDAQIARLAVEHLTERGFRTLAYCGVPGFNWSTWRQQYFQQFAERAGCRCLVHETLDRNDSSYSWARERSSLARWINQLPRPVGIMACYDIQAQKLLDVCREVGIAVPEEVAVLGVDNDRLVCDLADPPLTSIACDTHRTGYEAASLLDRMMSGESVPSDPILIAPLGIEARQSTDILAIDDPDVAAAVRFIREQALRGINVQDVLNAVPTSRRSLESRFRKLLGRTPHQEITRLRIDRVKRLLTETDLTLAEIAHRTGYEHIEYLSVAFKKATGISPSRYRAR